MNRETAGRQAGSVLLRRISSGTSGADVYLLEQPDATTVATKVTRSPRVQGPMQALRRDLIARHLPSHTPQVLATVGEAELDVIVTAAPSIQTLDEAVDSQGPTPQLRTVWRNVVDTLVGVWQQTAQPGFEPHRATRNHKLRCRRGHQGLDYALASAVGNPDTWARILVNGEQCGSWAELFTHLLRLGRPLVHVTCHGDPHAGNVLVDADGRWYLIDWEWSGNHHDWRMMASHLVGGWYIRDLVASADGSVTRTPTGLAIDWVAGELPRLRRFEAPAAAAFGRMTSRSRAGQDLEDVARHLALLLLREIPRAVQQRRPHLVAPLLGECVRLLSRNASAHPAMQAMAASQAMAVA